MTKYERLRKAATKATCGSWSLDYGDDFFYDGDALICREIVGYLPICRVEGAHPKSGFEEGFIKEQQHNAEFIAAANPTTVLELLDELEAAEKRIAELGKQCAEWERKALSNFEECAAMAERIEEMSKQSCEARERDLFESWVMHSICISKSTLEGLRTETGYRNATLSGTDFNRMWEQWKSIRGAGIRIKGE
ncbi:ead/Ea22-like family protein [Escherichia coli]|nr:ead/Ea22-like family protein [Escherichia coli]